MSKSFVGQSLRAAVPTAGQVWIPENLSCHMPAEPARASAAPKTSCRCHSDPIAVDVWAGQQAASPCGRLSSADDPGTPLARAEPPARLDCTCSLSQHLWPASAVL